MPMRSPATLGAENFRKLVRQGQAQMPPFPRSRPARPIASRRSRRILLTLGTNRRRRPGDANTPLRLPPNPSRYQGPEVRYAGAFSAGWYTSNGLPAFGPPWTQLVAYDLNDGSVKWRIPDGTSPGLAAQGITGTGSVRPKNGPVVTAGGLVIIANDQDRTLRAYDKADGRLLWEHEIPANPEGIPAVYAVGGRQYIAFSAGASWGTGGDPVWRNAFHRKPSETEGPGLLRVRAAGAPRSDPTTTGAHASMTRTLRLALIGAIALAGSLAGSLGLPGFRARCTRSRRPRSGGIRARRRCARTRHLADAHAGRRRASHPVEAGACGPTASRSSTRSCAPTR